ncbi:4-(cytidine 5'-diphospho)-2-C-methyl-D-erythritol kinase [Pararhodobacter oceanensis]|uniref:4-diphosphocytidyl-2-C-methyl-D-erythritol kinase n=1 Tax=Pararhodobacter oceanensis TaxID=2172121 RepID=A0A2T8HYP5_9RHOB|nr:4-(cytidine 5'-diphospho)-2-C-methyl-D-erythritol kinase [Pararhodobacter oceanensis]PVH30548.1 4-(cytidine 5'-diphospho)-2-C-methyl-D-erythritol kinase [Pararhodobacter oceanensis]
MTEVSALAPAKINLTLHVIGQRSDGYHLLDSLVVFTELGDEIALREADALSLEITGAQAAGLAAEPDNLVLRAARLMGEAGAAITLDKRLPVTSGMGGGSSDAATTLRLLAQKTGAALPDTAQAMTLGADLPVCLAAPVPSRMQGLGEAVTPVAHLPPLWMLLVNPGQGLPTPEVFKVLETKNNPPMPAQLPMWRDARELCDWLASQRNDLEPPARHLLPVIDQVLDALAAQPGCLLARMTGSGATCFGIFISEAQRDHAAKALARPEWFIGATRSYGSPE